VDSETDGPRYQVGETDWETADDPNAQFHHDIAGEVDKHLGLREPGQEAAEHHEEVMDAAGRVLARVFVFCLTDRKGQPRPLTEGLRRFVSVVAVLRPDLLANKTYKQLARRLHCTHACLSGLALEFSDSLNLHFRRQYRQSSRDVFRRAQSGRRHWRHRRKAEGAKQKPARGRSRGRGG
jgi:hypothetical protein